MASYGLLCPLKTLEKMKNERKWMKKKKGEIVNYNSLKKLHRISSPKSNFTWNKMLSLFGFAI